jgi:hypothetical protein
MIWGSDYPHSESTFPHFLAEILAGVVGRRTGQACSGPKGGTSALRDLDLFRCDRDTYAATLTTLDDALSLKFEQAAPLPGDRIAAAARLPPRRDLHLGVIGAGAVAGTLTGGRRSDPRIRRFVQGWPRQ